MGPKFYTGLYPYMGAKGNDAEHYVELFRYFNAEGKQITRLVDTNFGAGNIVSASAGLFKERVSNDIDERIVTLARTVSNPEKREAVLYKLMKLEPSERVYKFCGDALKNKRPITETQRAVYIWYRFFYGFNGNGGDFSPHHRQESLLNRRDLLSTFDGVKVRNMDMVDLLLEEKENPEQMKTTMYYLDPPYLDNKAEYANNMTSEQEHQRLLEAIKDIPNIMISGYDSQLYQQILCEQYGFWKYEMGEKAISMNMSLYGEERKRKMECIWTSYPIKGAFMQ